MRRTDRTDAPAMTVPAMRLSGGAYGLGAGAACVFMGVPFV